MIYKWGYEQTKENWWLLKGFFVQAKKKEVQNKGNGENKYKEEKGRKRK
jgi:hypothetical protein